MFKTEAESLMKAEPRAGQCSLEYVLAFERYRHCTKDAGLASADHAAYLNQLNELQRAMDEAWARAMTDIRAARKKRGDDPKGKPPEGMFDEKKKKRRKDVCLTPKNM